MRIEGFPIQTPLGARPGLWIQPRYKAPCDFRDKVVQNVVINIRLVRLSPRKWQLKKEQGRNKLKL